MTLTRRNLLLSLPAAAAAQSPLDRQSIVSRHNPTFHAPDPHAPLSIGNGEFAFTADFTGLQTFPGLYERTIPLCTQSQWGWHSFPLPTGLDPAQLRLEMFETYGRQVGYPTSAKGQEPLFNWLRENPHRLNLARIGLILADGRPPAPSDVSAIDQRLDLWTGTLRSRFRLKGSPVEVTTCCHPSVDALAISVESPQPLAIAIEFPYGSPAINASDWSAPTRHRTTVLNETASSLHLEHALDADRYHVRLGFEGAATTDPARHRIVIAPRPKSEKLELTAHFTARPASSGPPSFAQARAASEAHWSHFWTTGGAIDLAHSTDRRAQELERRIVLSQYLTAIQCAGSAPPQETGLTCNSWYGKFHLEMHWWHAAHFPLWNRAPLLERSLGWYASILPSAREKARSQGYTGARWPKMTALDGRDSPSNIGPLLIWQQPHIIAMAELCYRSHPDNSTLARYSELVAESAEFMASYAVERNGRYILGPPVIPAQENHPPRETWNPTFELTYWREALEIAQQWRERAGQPRNRAWESVRTRMSPLPARDGVYLAHENCPQTYKERNRDHPSMLAALGVLNGTGVDRETMRRTLKKVFAEWRWEDTWGWDFPMVAMTAARLHEPELAMDALFIESPKNHWAANGHNYQRDNLQLYLPGNGGLLTAVAMMAAKWNAFPGIGWRVRHEGLKPLL